MSVVGSDLLPRSIRGHVRVLATIVMRDIGLLSHVSGLADPLTVGWVDTDQIEYVSSRPNKEKNVWSDAGLVLDGDWDRDTDRFVDSSEWYRILSAHFKDGVAWEDIPAIQRRLDMVEQGRTVMDGRDTIDGVFDRCELIDRIFYEIRENGYRTQVELAKGENETHSKKWLPFKRTYHEIAVDVARDGELLFVDGRHRLSIAKILGIDRVPVRIVVRHKRFVENSSELNLDPMKPHPPHPFLPLTLVNSK